MINDLLGKHIAGKYRVDALMRETELGDFYQGTNTDTGVPVTIKILAPAMAIDARYVDRFLAEAKSASKVSHRNILNSVDVGSDAKGIPYAVYEGIDGSTLAEQLKLYGPMAEPRAIGIAKQIASALGTIHLADLVHGGLNPNKVLISTIDGVDSVKVYDLGLRSHARNSMSAVPYLSPEQSRDSSVSDKRVDIYSLGVLLYEMIAGEPPFRAATPSAIIEKRTAEPPAPLSAYRHDLHAQLEPIILTAMATDPERRYQTAADIEEDLARLATETGAVLPGPDLKVAGETAPATRAMWKTAVVVIAGIALLSAGLIYATYTRQTNPTITTEADLNSSPVQPINPATGAQEEAMLRMGDLGDASLSTGADMGVPADSLPGGDGYNAWANGVPPAGAPLNSGATNFGAAPPIGAPPATYIPPPGQTVTIDPNGGSQFMPNDGGVILVPIPVNPEPKASPTPKAPTAGASPSPDPNAPAGTKPPASSTDGKPAVKAQPTPAVKRPAGPRKPAGGPAADESPTK